MPPQQARPPLVHPRPVLGRMALAQPALPRLVLLLPALPRVAPAAGAHPVRPLPPALPRVARMVLLLAGSLRTSLMILTVLALIVR